VSLVTVATVLVAVAEWQIPQRYGQAALNLNPIPSKRPSHPADFKTSTQSRVSSNTPLQDVVVVVVMVVVVVVVAVTLVTDVEVTVFDVAVAEVRVVAVVVELDGHVPHETGQAI
jgi:hypothetical protein